MGNICRSPVLEGWARQVAADAGLALGLDSAGTGGWHAGSPPDPRAIAVAARHGVDLRGQRARQVVDADFEAMDLILCADADNVATLRSRQPRGSRATLALVFDWTGVGPGQDVPDPYYGDLRDFEHVNALARAAAEGLLRRVQGRA